MEPSSSLFSSAKLSKAISKMRAVFGAIIFSLHILRLGCQQNKDQSNFDNTFIHKAQLYISVSAVLYDHMFLKDYHLRYKYVVQVQYQFPNNSQKEVCFSGSTVNH